MKRRTAWLLNFIGVFSLVAIGALLWFTGLSGRQKPAVGEVRPEGKVTITFDRPELIYDGTGTLDLMEGVSAADENGGDITERVSAVITGDSMLHRKVVRYMVCSDSGLQTSCKRPLVLKNYTGPVLRVQDPLYLDAQDLSQVARVCADAGNLTAEDGFGRDIAGHAEIVREHVEGNRYRMNFRLMNAFQDCAEETVTAYITGLLQNPRITLLSDSLELAPGSYFRPEEWIETADNGSGAYDPEDLFIQSPVDTSLPGSYRVVYTLYNQDKSARATAALQVNVQE